METAVGPPAQMIKVELAKVELAGVDDRQVVDAEAETKRVFDR